MKKLCVIRRVLCSFLAAAMMISVAGCNKIDKPGKNTASLNSARQITNYFKSTDFQYPDEISDVSSILSINGKMYVSGYVSADNAEHYATVYDTATGEKADIDVSDINIGYFQNVLLSQDIVYIEYTDISNNNYISHICALNRSTGEKINDIELGSETYTTGLYTNTNGDLCTIATTYSANSEESMMIVYDKTNLEEKEKINISEKLNLPDGHMVMLVLPQTDGTYYAFSMDIKNSGDDEKINVYKLSSAFEVIYNIDDACSDMEGYLNGAFVKENGNLCIMTYDYNSDSGIYNTNELDSLTGDVVGRYEPQLSHVEILPFYTIGEYDFLFKRDSKLFGYDIDNSKETEIVDFTAQLGEEYENCYTMSALGNSLLLATEYYGGGSSEMLYELDQDGNLLNKISLPEGAQSYRMKVSNDGLINVICTDYSDGEQKNEICTIDTQGNETGRIELSLETDDGTDSYMNDFLINSSGEICVSFQLYSRNGSDGKDKNIVVVFNKDGNEKFRIEDENINYVNGMISGASGDYVYYYKDKSGYELCKIDYDKKSLGETVNIDVNFNNMYPGDEKFDFYYDDEEGIYGYNIKDNKTTEIINWIDSDIDANISNTCIINSDKIMLRGYDRQTGETSIYQLDRVDDETLKLIQNKKIITVAGVNITYGGIKDAVIKFNKENDKYRMQVNDYSKYSTYENDTYLSGANRLNTDLASGSLPDILIGNYELDMSSYISKGLLTDLNPLIENDKDISKDDYFENIFDIYSTDGKLYQLVTDFNITTLVGKESDLGDKSGWTFDEFFEFADGKKAFYVTGREELLDSFVLDNLSEYVDFNKKTCDFNNDNFIKLLEYIKENGLTQEELDEQSYYGKRDFDEDRYNEFMDRFKNKKCYLEFQTIRSSDELAGLQQSVLGEAASFKGLPSSSEGNGALICSDTTIGISEKSAVREGAWDFVRGFMLEDYQNNLNAEYSYTIPIMKSAFEDMLKKSQSESSGSGMYYGGKDGEIKPLDSKTAEKFKNLVENTSRAAVSDSKINKIIKEQVNTFFENGQSAKEAAEAIQSKASLYLKEIK